MNDAYMHELPECIGNYGKPRGSNGPCEDCRYKGICHRTSKATNQRWREKMELLLQRVSEVEAILSEH